MSKTPLAPLISQSTEAYGKRENYIGRSVIISDSYLPFPGEVKPFVRDEEFIKIEAELEVTLKKLGIGKK
jgi:hypothetical protein